MTTRHGFELLREEYIAEIDTQARLFRHVKSGAELLSLENGDENKVFGIAFRTPPSDSTGIAHILEHAVLGGSKKYPLKEPFVQLLKGSLHTFLNAFTSPDRTTYPVASTNLQDFYNLVEVYLDAVFHPLLTPHHLDQEGWHYELAQTTDPLAYRGVVFNEMKGVYSSPDAIHHRAGQQALFPDNAYSFDSGGDPHVIPQLTYEQFTRFHATYYHPSNARIFFYGDDDPEERLRILDAVLTEYNACTVDSLVPLQKPFAAPRRIEVPFDADGTSDTSRKAMLDVNWVLPEITDPTLQLALSALSYAMIGTQASPLRTVLMDSGLGEDVTGGLSLGLRQPIFSAGMKGISLADIDTLEALIFKTLERLAEDGIDAEMLEAAVNSIEFSLRENNTGSYPRGLSMLMRALRNWTYDLDPLAPLKYAAPLAVVKHRFAADADFAKVLIRTYLLSNDHRATVIARPEPGLNERQEADEQARLALIQAELTLEQSEQIVENTRLLKLRQQTPDAPELLAALPSLKLSDLEQENKLIPIEISEKPDRRLLYHDLFTNGIVYLNLGFDLQPVPQELLPYVPFFGRALTGMGTQEEDYVKFSQRIGRKTGGVWYSIFLSSRRNEPTPAVRFMVSGKATTEQSQELLAILRDMLLTVKLDDQERFKQLVLQTKARKESSLIPSGHAYVRDRLSVGFTTASWADEQMSGIDGLFFVRRLAEQVETDRPAVREKLETVRQLLINRTGMVNNVTLDGANWTRFEPQFEGFLDELPGELATPATWNPSFHTEDEGLAIPAQVNYVGKGANLYDVGYDYHGSIHAINKYVRTGWLWDKVRAEGGAYGAFVSFSKQSGVYSFLSYRDPNLENTLNIYDETARVLRSVELSKDELTKSIIGAISDVDGYQLPDAKGYTSMVRYLIGETDADRQQMRDQILGTTAADFRAFGEVLSSFNEQARVVVMGDGETLARWAESSDHKPVVTKVM